MYGAIIGDVIGSAYEWNNIKSKQFPLFSKRTSFTDDTVMTMAVANALLIGGKDREAFQKAVVSEMRRLGREYPNAGYGGRFAHWLRAKNPEPYNSFGNGSAMRVSPCALAATTLEEAQQLAEASAAVTHNHPEGIKGARAIAAAIWMAGDGAGKEDIQSFIRENYYPLQKKLDDIRPGYIFDETCQGSTPEAIQAFLESVDFEDAIRNAISIGGDSDTIADMAGAIAWAYYGRDGATAAMNEIWNKVQTYLPDEFLTIIHTFEQKMAI